MQYPQAVPWSDSNFHCCAATQVSEKSNLVGGLSLGFMQFVMFCSYAVALFFGAYRIAAGAYTGGYVINVIFAALIGSFSVGMVSVRSAGTYHHVSIAVKLTLGTSSGSSSSEPTVRLLVCVQTSTL
jgi:hypothetical protein